MHAQIIKYAKRSMLDAALNNNKPFISKASGRGGNPEIPFVCLVKLYCYALSFLLY